jgi:hypothetical protein
MIAEVSRLYGRVDLLDIGGTAEYWQIVPEEFLERHCVSITIVNQFSSPSGDYGRFRFMVADGCALPIDDDTYHIAHSNSVVEHVGDWSRMVAFAGELRRVAIRYYVQTPNYWFPVEPHFGLPLIHWLPMPWRYSMVQRTMKPQHRTYDRAIRRIESARLLNRRMMRCLFPGARHITERYYGLPKSLIAVSG